jgi:hypothetical protein
MTTKPGSATQNAADGKSKDKTKWQHPVDHLRVSDRTRALTADQRSSALWKHYRLGQSLQEDLDQDPHIYLSDEDEIKILAEAQQLHPDYLRTCLRLANSITEAQFKVLVDMTAASYADIAILAGIPIQECGELVERATQNEWPPGEITKEIRRRYPAPPKPIKPFPSPRSLKQSRERLQRQSTKYLSVLEQLFGKYNLATEVFDTPPASIKPDLPGRLRECQALLRQVGSLTARAADELSGAISHADKVVENNALDEQENARAEQK